MGFRKCGDDMCPMGRPKSNNPKSMQLTVRLDEATFEKLDESAKILNETRVQVIRRGIEKVFLEVKK